MFQEETFPKHSPKLVLIADDVTGTFDTGVQFSKRGASVSFLTAEQAQGDCPDADVIVIDAETRHLSAEHAYALTRRLAEQACRWQIGCIYIKTDSGLRGNVGEALKAALDAAGEKFLAFAPAYPAMERVTRNGQQWVAGVPLRDSVFGKDLFEPVDAPGIRELIEPTGARVVEIPRGAASPTAPSEPIIAVYDAETDEDLHNIVSALAEKNQLRLLGGCAAFASALAPHLGLPESLSTPPAIAAPLLVICGSLNPITRKQVEFGEGLGYQRLTLTLEQLLQKDYFSSLQGAEWLGHMEQLLRRGQTIMLDTGLCNPSDLSEYGGLTMDAARETIAATLGQLLVRLMALSGAEAFTPMIIGGDTLMGAIRCMAHPSITLEGEVDTGVVVFTATIGKRRVRMLSKSGGLGSKTLLKDVVYHEEQNEVTANVQL